MTPMECDRQGSGFVREAVPMIALLAKQKIAGALNLWKLSVTMAKPVIVTRGRHDRDSRTSRLRSRRRSSRTADGRVQGSGTGCDRPHELGEVLSVR